MQPSFFVVRQAGLCRRGCIALQERPDNRTYVSSDAAGQSQLRAMLTSGVPYVGVHHIAFAGRHSVGPWITEKKGAGRYRIDWRLVRLVDQNDRSGEI